MDASDSGAASIASTIGGDSAAKSQSASYRPAPRGRRGPHGTPKLPGPVGNAPEAKSAVAKSITLLLARMPRNANIGDPFFPRPARLASEAAASAARAKADPPAWSKRRQGDEDER